MKKDDNRSKRNEHLDEALYVIARLIAAQIMTEYSKDVDIQEQPCDHVRAEGSDTQSAIGEAQ